MARYVSNAERGAANLVALVLSYRNKHKQIDKSIETLAQRLDEKIIQLKNEILGGASSAFDTLAELQQIIEQNQEGIRVLESLAAGHVRFDRLQNLNANEKAIGRQNLDAVSKAELEAAVNAVIPMTPTVSVQKTGTVTTVITTDGKGTTTAEIKDGEKGAHYTPLVDDEGNLSWTNDGGLPNPLTKNIRGPRGLQGQQGVPGVQGEKGDPGAGLTIHAEYPSYEDLVAKHPVGEEGDAYLINGDVWYWAEENQTWKNGGQLRGPQGVRGPQGFTFTPHLQSDGTLYFTNDGGLDNPTEVNLRGPRGFHFTPTVDSNGNITWTNDGGLTNPVAKNIRGPRGFTYTPYLNSDGVLSFTNDGGLSNPAPVDLTGPRGYHFTPSVDGKGNLSWTNNGNLTNPTTQNIRGYHYTPSLDADCNLSWTNTGDLENPPTQNIRGFHFTPSVDSNGNISWTNNGGMTNPATVNIRGPRGFTFTPSVSDKGIISWTNNGGLANPSPIDIKGPCIIRVSGYAYNPVSTKEEWEAILESGVMSLGLGELQNLRPNDFIIWTGLYQGDNILGDPDGLGLIGFQAVATVVSVDLTNLKVYFKDGLFLRGTAGKDGKDGQSYIGLKPTFGTAQTFAEWQSFVNSNQVNFTVYKEDLNHPYANDIGIIFGTISDRDSVSVAIFVQIKTSSTQADGTLLSITAEPMGWIFSGLQGEKGDAGKNGATFTPSVDASGNLSWSNDGGLANPATVNIKGQKGDQGIQGPKGDGLNFEDLTPEQIAEIKGPKGDQGERGYHFTPSVNGDGVLSWSNDGGLSNPPAVSVKGPKGDAFVYDDFTEAQLKALRGPKGETGDSTRIVTVEFATRPSMKYDLAMSYGGETYIGNVPTDYQTRIKEGDLLAVPILIDDRDNMQAVLFGEFKDFLYAGSVSLGIRILGCLVGEPGATFTPSVDSSGNLSWANDKGLKNPTTRNIMGPAGKDGSSGKDGVDGKTPQVSFRYDSATGNLYYTVTTE